jgi:hypothetical protein
LGNNPLILDLISEAYATGVDARRQTLLGELLTIFYVLLRATGTYECILLYVSLRREIGRFACLRLPNSISKKAATIENRICFLDLSQKPVKFISIMLYIPKFFEYAHYKKEFDSFIRLFLSIHTK